YRERLAEQVERLAHHAWHGNVWDKSVLYGQQASAKAIARSAYAQAVASCERALEALTPLPERPERAVQAIDLRLDLCGALTWIDQHGRALAVLREAEASATTLDDQPRLSRIFSWMCLGLRMVGELDAAIAVGQRALTIATGLGDAGLAVE